MSDSVRADLVRSIVLKNIVNECVLIFFFLQHWYRLLGTQIGRAAHAYAITYRSLRKWLGSGCQGKGAQLYLGGGL